MPILDVQRRGQQIGRLRIGQKVATGKTDKNGDEIMRPARLDTWRLTTASRLEAEAIAARFGGDVRDWEHEFEVITSATEIPVTVPPRDEVISQWYEMWNKGGCLRRCDSQTEQISGKACLCPHAEDLSDTEESARKALERADLAKRNPPQACKLVTRINVMIPDLPGLGVFRLDTGSYYAAVEIGDTARLLQMARDKGVFLPAMLRIEQRQRVAGGQTKKYPVPVLEVLATFRDLATGAIESAGMIAQLPPAPGERLAIAAAPSVPAPRPQRPPTAQDIANAAAKATTRPQIVELKALAEEHRVQQDMILPPGTDVYEELDSYLHGRWEELPAGGVGNG
jgi:Recombination directionality factor-like